MKQIGEIVKGLEKNPVTMSEPCVDKLHYENILTVKNCPTCKKVSGLEEETEELTDMFGEGGAEEIKEENLEEELTGCCDASIVEQTGRCSKCGESV